MSNGSGSAQISPLMGLSPSRLSPLSLYLGVKNSGVVTAFVTLSAYHRHRRPQSTDRPTIHPSATAAASSFVSLSTRSFVCPLPRYSLATRCAHDAPCIVSRRVIEGPRM